jgi:putative transposase
VGRTSYYCPQTIRARADQQAVAQLQATHEQHPFYGVRRLALHLGWSENKTRRIRTLAGVRAARAGRRYAHHRGEPEIAAPPNVLHRYAVFKDETRPQDGMVYAGMVEVAAWVQNFTYLWFERSQHYLAVVLDLKTRQAVGWRLGTSHSSELTYAALLDALSRHSPPAILHSDQGSEYLCFKHQLLCERLEIQLSCSAKSSPWQNGFMETWFGNFKAELGSLSKFQDLAQLHEGIALQIHYYNTKRIHLALKTTPAAYAASLQKRDNLFAEKGA